MARLEAMPSPPSRVWAHWRHSNQQNGNIQVASSSRDPHLEAIPLTADPAPLQSAGYDLGAALSSEGHDSLTLHMDVYTGAVLALGLIFVVCFTACLKAIIWPHARPETDSCELLIPQ